MSSTHWQSLLNGSFEKHINRLRNYYQNKRDLILRALEKKPLGDYVTIEEEEAGVHFLMHLRTDLKEESIVTQAKSCGKIKAALRLLRGCGGGKQSRKIRMS